MKIYSQQMAPKRGQIKIYWSPNGYSKVKHWFYVNFQEKKGKFEGLAQIFECKRSFTFSPNPYLHQRYHGSLRKKKKRIPVAIIAE